MISAGRPGAGSTPREGLAAQTWCLPVPCQNEQVRQLHVTVQGSQRSARAISHVKGGVKGSEYGKSFEVVVGYMDETADVVVMAHRNLQRVQ